VPVAVETFVADYAYGVDGLTEVVAGEWVAPGHELVKRFGSRFRPDASRDKPNRGRWRSWTPPHHRSRAAASTTPRLEVILNERAWRDIDAADGLFDGTECGGALYGRRTPRGFEITDACGPGGSERTGYSIRHQFEYYRAIERCLPTDVHLIGTWHTHSNDATPSNVDLEAWRLSVGYVTPEDAFLGVIVARDHDMAPTRFHAWTTDRDGTRSAPVTLT
jgi:hypothetical protein